MIIVANRKNKHSHNKRGSRQNIRKRLNRKETEQF